MQYRADSTFSICGAVFQPDKSGLVDVPDGIAKSDEFAAFVEANSRHIVPAQPVKTAVKDAEA